MPIDIFFICGDDQIGSNSMFVWSLAFIVIGRFIVGQKMPCAQGWQSRVRILRDKRLQDAIRHEDMLNKLEGRIASGRTKLLNS